MLSLPLPLISFLCIFKDVYTSFFNPFWPSLMLLNKLCLLLQSQTLSSSIFKLEIQVVLFCVENISSFLITFFFFRSQGKSSNIQCTLECPHRLGIYFVERKKRDDRE